MRDNVTPRFKDLTASGSNTISVTPGTAAVPAKFETSGIRPREANGFWNYLTRFWQNTTLTFDPDAAGNAVHWDKLYKGVQSVELVSKDLGVIYSHQNTRGAVLGHLIQVVGLGYQYPQPARTQIPASTDSDVTIDLTYCIPLSHDVLAKPIETAQWVGFFDNGTLEIIMAASSVYDGDYAGAVYKAPTTLRAVAEYVQSPDQALGVPFQWQDREITGGGDSPILRQVGVKTGWEGTSPGCGLMVLAWLSNATGIGLGGPDGVDNITNIEIPWLGQENLKNLDGFYYHLRKVTGKFGPRSGIGTTIVPDGAGWPTTMAVTTEVDNRPSANAQQMFLPILMPGHQMETSKAPRVLGDLTVSFNHTAAVSASHRFVTWELMEFSEQQVAALAMKAGFSGSADRKQLRNSDVGDYGKLRYTRVIFTP